MLDFWARRLASAWMLGAVLSACGTAYSYQAPPCQADEIPQDGGCVADRKKISLDSVGYLPTRAKTATLVDLDTFEIKRADGTVAMAGDAKGPVAADTAEANVKIADFGSLTEPGEYYLEASGPDGSLTSPHFHIGSDVYDLALITVMLGLHGQRCGGAVHIEYGGFTFEHAECHVNDALTTYLDDTSVIRPSLRGWHDAGDYGKYVTNGAFALGILFKAWEHFPRVLAPLAVPIPEHGGALPDFLAECKWEVDWLLTMQLADGGAPHKVTALAFEPFIMPERDMSQRFYAPVGTAATAEIAAILAMAARIYEPYDPAYAAVCLEAAKLSYDYLLSHPAQMEPDLSAFTTGGYTLSDSGPRLWAAAEIFETTGLPAALVDLENRVRSRATSKNMSIVDSSWDWGNPANLGLYTYLLSSSEGRDAGLLQKIKDQNQQRADAFARASEAHAYGRAGIQYVWGSNGTVARIVMNLQVAYRLSGDTRYLDAAVRQIDHLFGRNYYARSQVTGIGDKPVLHPHHRPSSATGRAWPGLLVGGANPGPTDWVDVEGQFDQNEVALNWNAALVYALAGFATGTNEGTGFYPSPPDGGPADADAGVDDAPIDRLVDQSILPPMDEGAPDDAESPDADDAADDTVRSEASGADATGD